MGLAKLLAPWKGFGKYHKQFVNLKNSLLGIKFLSEATVGRRGACCKLWKHHHPSFSWQNLLAMEHCSKLRRLQRKIYKCFVQPEVSPLRWCKILDQLLA